MKKWGYKMKNKALSATVLFFLGASAIAFVAMVLGASLEYQSRLQAANRYARQLQRRDIFAEDLSRAVETIAQRSPAVGGMIVDLQRQIKRGDDVGDQVAQLPKTDWAILTRERVLKHGLERYGQFVFGLSAPVRTPGDAYISSEYGQGWITVPIDGRWRTIVRTHPGIDIVSRFDSIVTASASGRVAKSAENVIYGNYVLIEHSSELRTFYAHLELSFVSAGEEIERGDEIGRIGNTGHSFGDHLHYEVHVNRAGRWHTVNPLSRSTYAQPLSSERYPVAWAFR